MPGFAEFFLSNRQTSKAVNQARSRGEVRRVVGSLHTSELDTPLEVLIPTRLHRVIAVTHPGAVLSARTATLNGYPASDGSVFLTHPGRRKLMLPGGILLRSRPGAGPMETDTPRVPDLVWSSSDARALLEHLQVSRSRDGRVSRTFSRTELEEWLDRRAQELGDGYLNALRDQASQIAEALGLAEYLPQVHELIGSFLGSVSTPGVSHRLRARQAGEPHDHARVEMFDALRTALVGNAPRVIGLPAPERRVVLPFVDAYFSNYIEGTEFAFDQAAGIVFDGAVPAGRPADAHDITGTYNVLSAFSPGMQLPTSPEHLIAVLQGMHRGIMHGRPDKSPGAFKLRENRVGARIFVHPDRVQGTLKEGYARYAELTDPFARAVFMMFMVSEVHPFEDGNGRTARAMMNAELWSAGQSPVLIPTVFRGDYLSALRAMSTHGTPAALLAVLDFARTYASELNCSTVPEAELDLAATNAFEVSDQPGVRLVLPSRVAGAP